VSRAERGTSKHSTQRTRTGPAQATRRPGVRARAARLDGHDAVRSGRRGCATGSSDTVKAAPARRPGAEADIDSRSEDGGARRTARCRADGGRPCSRASSVPARDSAVYPRRGGTLARGGPGCCYTDDSRLLSCRPEHVKASAAVGIGTATPATRVKLASGPAGAVRASDRRCWRGSRERVTARE